jgi:hypothetical protein
VVAVSSQHVYANFDISDEEMENLSK